MIDGSNAKVSGIEKKADRKKRLNTKAVLRMDLIPAFLESYKTCDALTQLAAEKQLRWLTTARANQIAPEGDWIIWLILAGRGWGKTQTGAEDVAWYGITNPGARIALIGATSADCRDTMVEGESGLLKAIPGAFIENWNRSLGEISLINGTKYKTFSAEEPERLRGPQHHRAWADELAAWQRPETFDQIMFGLRLGQKPQLVITTTPKPTMQIRTLVKRAGDRSDVIVTSGKTAENEKNLAPAFLSRLMEKYAGTRLGRQELDAELIEDVAGALWTRSNIDATRIHSTNVEFERIVVAIDPAVSSNAGSDETGIVCAAKGFDGHFYILDDVSGTYTPDQWANAAVGLYKRREASRIIGEVNNGGDMIEKILRHVEQNVPYTAVRASKGKAIRAEPIAALYEQHKVHHVGSFQTLEDQMCMFTTDYDRAKMKYSPDRLDALVWALTELALQAHPGDNIMAYWRTKQAEAQTP